MMSRGLGTHGDYIQKCHQIKRAPWNDSTQIMAPLIHCGFQGLSSRSGTCTEKLSKESCSSKSSPEQLLSDSHRARR